MQLQMGLKSKNNHVDSLANLGGSDKVPIQTGDSRQGHCQPEHPQTDLRGPSP